VGACGNPLSNGWFCMAKLGKVGRKASQAAEHTFLSQLGPAPKSTLVAPKGSRGKVPARTMGKRAESGTRQGPKGQKGVAHAHLHASDRDQSAAELKRIAPVGATSSSTFLARPELTPVPEPPAQESSGSTEPFSQDAVFAWIAQMTVLFAESARMAAAYLRRPENAADERAPFEKEE
jgi:hypothetical protein